jgi:hypothetical protein
MVSSSSLEVIWLQQPRMRTNCPRLQLVSSEKKGRKGRVFGWASKGLLSTISIHPTINHPLIRSTSHRCIPNLPSALERFLNNFSRPLAFLPNSSSRSSRTPTARRSLYSAPLLSHSCSSLHPPSTRQLTLTTSPRRRLLEALGSPNFSLAPHSTQSERFISPFLNDRPTSSPRPTFRSSTTIISIRLKTSTIAGRPGHPSTVSSPLSTPFLSPSLLPLEPRRPEFCNRKLPQAI